MAMREKRQEKDSGAHRGHIPAVLLLQILKDGEASNGEVRFRPLRAQRSKRGVFQVGTLVMAIAAASVLALLGVGVLYVTR